MSGRPLPDAALLDVLEAQRRREFIGPGAWEGLITHALAFADLVDKAPTRAVDLGSGGGLPGLVLARCHWPEARWTLLDASQRRCTALELSAADLGLTGRVRVMWARAEEAGRHGELRGHADLVVARRFASPAATAECAAPLLRTGGALVVSEPPDADGARWPVDGLALVGQAFDRTQVVEGFSFSRVTQESPCPDRFPRRPGQAVSRPLF